MKNLIFTIMILAICQNAFAIQYVIDVSDEANEVLKAHYQVSTIKAVEKKIVDDVKDRIKNKVRDAKVEAYKATLK